MPRQKFEKILKGPYCDGPQKRQRQTQGCPTEHRFAKLHVHYAQGKRETRQFSSFTSRTAAESCGVGSCQEDEDVRLFYVSLLHTTFQSLIISQHRFWPRRM